MIHVCSLAALPATVAATGAQHILTVMANVSQVERPASVLEANHLRIQMDDINEPAMGFTAPSYDHVEQALAFIRKWDRTTPMVIHCYAGSCRATAGPFISACALNPHRDETSIARQMRSASPSAYPNRLIVTLADRLLGRNGRMVRALDAMGPSNMSLEGKPFRVELE